MGQKRLDNLMIISEEGRSCGGFYPDHAINAWYSKKNATSWRQDIT